MNLYKEDYARDAALSEAIHGNTVKARGGYLASKGKNGAAYQAATNEYFNYWDNTSIGKEISENRKIRQESYGTVSNRYYDLISDFFEHVLGTSMHFYRIVPGIPLKTASTQHEQYLAQKLGLQEGYRVLDVGSGVGGPARQIAKFRNVEIVGINNNDYQIQRAIRYTTKEDLSHKVSFVKGDFMQMKFEPASFDAAYSIEGTSYAPSLQGVYSEIFKSLKPGHTFAVYEMVLTDAYDDDNPEHRRIRNSIEKGVGATNLVRMSQAIEAIRAAGFDLEEVEDLACRPNEIPWYSIVTGSLRHINSVHDIKRMVHIALLRRPFFRRIGVFAELLGLLPAGSKKVYEMMDDFADSLIEAGKQGLFTPLCFMLARKPA